MGRGTPISDLLRVPYDAALREDHADAVRRTFDEVCASGTGRLIVITGPDGMGKTAFTAHILAQLSKHQTKPVVLACSFDAVGSTGRISGQLLPSGGVEAATVLTGLGQLVSTAAAAATVADPSGALKVGTSIAALVGQGLQGAGFVAGERLGRTGANPRLGPVDVMHVIRSVTHADRPLILAIDDMHLAEPQLLWCGLFLSDLLAQALTQLPALVIVTADEGRAPSGDHPDPSELTTTLEEVACAPGNVRLYMQPLTPDDLPHLDERLAADVVSLTAGSPGWIARLLDDWRTQHAISFDPSVRLWRTSAWTPITPRTTVEDLLRACLWKACTEVVTFDIASRMLALAALEGMIFTAEAVAGAAHLDPDVVIDWMDDHLVPMGVLRFEGFRNVPARGDRPTRNVSRYKFESSLVWRTLHPANDKRTDINALGRLTRDHIVELVRTYNGQLSQIATSLSRMCLTTGDAAGAANYERVLDDLGSTREHQQLIGSTISRLKLSQESGISWSDPEKLSAARRVLRAASALQYRDAGVSAIEGFALAYSFTWSNGDWAKAASSVVEVQTQALRGLGVTSVLSGAMGDAILYEDELTQLCMSRGDVQGAALPTVRITELLGSVLSTVERGRRDLWNASARLRLPHLAKIPERFGALTAEDPNEVDRERLAEHYKTYVAKAAESVRSATPPERPILGTGYFRGLGRRALALDDFATASRHFRTALWYVPNDPHERLEARALLVNALRSLGEFEQARIDLRYALRDCIQLGIQKRLPGLLRALVDCERALNGPAATEGPLAHALNVTGRVQDRWYGRHLWLDAADLFVDLGRPRNQAIRCVAMAAAATDPNGTDTSGFTHLLSHIGLAPIPPGALLDEAREAWTRSGGTALVNTLFGVDLADTDAFLFAMLASDDSAPSEPIPPLEFL